MIRGVCASVSVLCVRRFDAEQHPAMRKFLKEGLQRDDLGGDDQDEEVCLGHTHTRSRRHTSRRQAGTHRQAHTRPRWQMDMQTDRHIDIQTEAVNVHTKQKAC